MIDRLWTSYMNSVSIEEINRLLDEHEQSIEDNHCSCYWGGAICCDCGREGPYREEVEA